MAQLALLVRPARMDRRAILGLRVQLEPLARLSRGLLAQRGLLDHLAPLVRPGQLDHKARLARLALPDLRVLPEQMDLLAPREPMAPTDQLDLRAAMGLTVQLAQRVLRAHQGRPAPLVQLHLLLDPQGLLDRGLQAQLELVGQPALLGAAEAVMEPVEISFLLTTLEVSNGRHINTNLYADA